MLTTLLVPFVPLLLAAQVAPDAAYFPNLQRPHTPALTWQRDNGPVILIVVDAMRPDHLTPYDATRPTAPNLARLADDGVVLTNYFVNGNWTRPSTATLLTGLSPGAHGVEHERDRLADDFVTLAEVLSSVHIPTGAVVGNGNAGSAFGLARGFEFYADTVKHWKGLPSAEQVVELAVPYVRDHAQEPFFLMLFFVDPHDPYHAPAPFEDMFVTDPSVPLIRSPHWEAKKYSPGQVARMAQTYDGALRYTDTVLGHFFETLRSLGVYDKATILVTADHGEAFGEHQEYLHAHHLYDEIIRAPMIVRAPHMSARGVAADALVQTIDLLPTLGNYFGAQVSAKFPGTDMFAQLADPNRRDLARGVLCEFNNFGIHRRALRTYTRKLIQETPADAAEFKASVGSRALLPSVSFDKERWRAFDLTADPMEQHDIYSPALLRDPAWKKLAEALRRVPQSSPHRPRTPVAKHIDAETYQDLKSLGYVQ